LIRKYVSGQRNRLSDGEYDLDLTYVTPRVLAMSFPGVTFLQKMYRNDITTVSKYVKEKHGDHYWIYNLTGTEYDEDKCFEDRISTY